MVVEVIPRDRTRKRYHPRNAEAKDTTRASLRSWRRPQRVEEVREVGVVVAAGLVRVRIDHGATVFIEIARSSSRCGRRASSLVEDAVEQLQSTAERSTGCQLSASPSSREVFPPVE